MFAWILAALGAALATLVLRRKAPLKRRLLLAVPLLFVAVAAGLVGAGLRMEMHGGGIPGFFTFSNADRQADKIEAERAVEKTAAPQLPAEPAVVQAAETEAQGSGAAERKESPAAPPEAKATWPGYRGVNRDGVSKESILTTWPGGKLAELWRKPVGAGWASFAIAGDLLYTIEQRRDQEVVAAYDVASGREVWTHRYAADFQESMGGPGPRATPQWHDGVVYALGATGEFFALDGRTGKVIWGKNILSDNGAENITWAMSAAPLIVDDLVIVQPGGTAGKSIVAYRRKDGQRVWSALNDRASYASPVLATLGGVRQIVTVTAVRALGLDPSNGKLLWEYPWVTEYDINSAQPIVTGPNRVVISSGYGHGAVSLEIGPSGAKRIWENKKLKNKFNSSVYLDGYIYGFDEAIFTCISAATGEAAWKAGRYGYGQVLLASGHLVITTEQGEVVLLKADPAGHQELARFAALDGRTWNVPAIADGRLFVRNATEMAAYRIGGR